MEKLTEFEFDARELEILSLLGFQADGEETVGKFLTEVIKKNHSTDLHNEGIPMRSIMKMMKKLGIRKKTSGGNTALDNDEEIEALLNGLGI